MTLVSSGAIGLYDVNIELGLSGTATISLNDTAVRTLAGVASGEISLSNLYGKSNRVALSYTITTNTQELSLPLSSIGGYVAGKSDVTITVNSGVYVWSSTNSITAFIIGSSIPGGATSGDTIKLINNGIIMGCGGQGGTSTVPAGSGMHAIALGTYSAPITITNNGTIAAGGGGGGAGGGTSGGGGGAGGGAGGNTGNNGSSATAQPAGGGGGRNINGPGGTGSGFGGALYATGGGGGGGGGRNSTSVAPLTVNVTVAGGGGGFGAAGGAGKFMIAPNGTGLVGGTGGQSGYAGSPGTFPGTATSTTPGAAGGYALVLNGYTVTWITQGTVWGSVV